MMSAFDTDQDREAIIEKYKKGRSVEFCDPSEDPDIKDSETRDNFGFYHSKPLTKKEAQIEDKYRRNELRRFDKWVKMTDKWDEDGSTWQRMFREGKASEKLTRRIFKGIPQRFRMIVWPLLLCVPEVKRKHKDIYLKMLNQAFSGSTHLNQIDLDINRTFRNTIYFRDRYGPRQQALFRVLAAYSVYNSEVGYCQGMSQLAGLFLIYIQDEEDAFWALSQLMTGTRYRMHGVYVADFPGLRRLFAHHEKVMKRLLPALDRHFTNNQMFTTTYALKWYMQCFLDRLPVTLVLRIWDIYLLEGEKVLIAMAYNILKMHKKNLLRMDQTQMTCYLQDELAKDFLFDDDDVIDSLKGCLELLHKSHLDVPPPPTPNMLPTKPLGVTTPEPIWKNRNSAPPTSPTPSETIQTIPSMKPNLTNHIVHNGKYRPRRQQPNSPMKVVIVSSPSPSVSGSFSSPTANTSPGLATSATILTAAALANARHSQIHSAMDRYNEKAYYLTVGGYHPGKINQIAPAKDNDYQLTTIQYATHPSKSKQNATKIFIQHSPKQPRQNRVREIYPSKRAGNTEVVIPITNGYSTTDSRHYSGRVSNEFSTAVQREYSKFDNSSRARSQITVSPSLSNDVVLTSIRPRKAGSPYDNVRSKTPEPIYASSELKKQRNRNQSSLINRQSAEDLNRWASEQILCTDPHSPSTSGSSSSLDRPWHRKSHRSSQDKNNSQLNRHSHIPGHEYTPVWTVRPGRTVLNELKIDSSDPVKLGRANTNDMRTYPTFVPKTPSSRHSSTQKEEESSSRPPLVTHPKRDPKSSLHDIVMPVPHYVTSTSPSGLSSSTGQFVIIHSSSNHRSRSINLKPDLNTHLVQPSENNK